MNELQDILKQLRILKAYSLFLTAALVLMWFAGFISPPSREHIKEIDVERINVVDSAGHAQLVISNEADSPPPLFHGKPFGIAGGGRPGIIFYNDEETECGGLVFSGHTDSTGEYSATAQLSFDQYNQNQVAYLRYMDDNGQRETGLHIDDWHNSPPFPKWRAMYSAARRMPEGPERREALEQVMEPTRGHPAFAQRVFVGRDTNDAAIVVLADKSGRPRIEMAVDSLGGAKLEFLDSGGHVTFSLPDTSNRKPLR